MNHRCLELLLACVSLLVIVPAFGAEDVEIARLAAQVCATCHGPHGDSISSAFPRLSGQNAAYTEAQLSDNCRAHFGEGAVRLGHQRVVGLLVRVSKHVGEIGQVS